MNLSRAVDRPDDDHTLARLRADLSSRAERSGAAEVTHRTVDTPVGKLLLAATPRGLVRIAFDSEDHTQVLADLATRVSPRILPAAHRLDAAARELDEYFTGSRRTFDLPLDMTLARGFRLAVLEQLRGVGFGRQVSYSELALAAGSPRAFRAVGSACATNPLPVVVPCHRVRRSDGSLGGYRGGPAAKAALLQLEGASASR